MAISRTSLIVLGAAAVASAVAGRASALPSLSLPPAAEAKAVAFAPTKSEPLRLRAVTLDPNQSGWGRNVSSLDIVIERWTSDAEQDRLRDALQEKGARTALREAVQKIKPRIGYIRTPQSLGWDVQFARETVFEDGTRRIVLGSDRPLGLREISDRTRSSDYEFLLAEIILDANGRGSGRLTPAAMLSWDPGSRTVEIESLQAMPVRLMDVRPID